MTCLACFWISGISSDKPVINNGSNLWKYEYLQKKNVTDKFSNNSIKYSPKGKNIAINWRKRIEKKPKKNQIEELHFMHIHVFFFVLLKFMRFRSYLNSDLFELLKIVTAAQVSRA